MARTAYTYDPRFLLHDTAVDEIRLPTGQVLDPEPKPASARVVRRTAQLVANSGLLNDLVQLPARPAAEEDLLLFHTPGHVDRVRALATSGGGMLDGTPVAPGSWDAAILAAGTAIALTDAVLDGIVQRGFGLLRPPGHHAAADRTGGYSLFNNVALAALHARRRGVARVAIVDWDVHHGSGTQAAFWDDPTVLFVCLHQDNWFPAGLGPATDIGGDSALGATVNLALPPGTGDRGYLRALERVVVPILRQFRPELLLISAGQDANLRDPRGRMLVSMDGYRAMAAALREVADDVCGGRVIALQEDAFSAEYAPFCTLAVAEGLVDVRTAVVDPLQGDSELLQARRELRVALDDALRQTVESLAGFWGLG
ncbi:MAG TPA: class II histone deacetylase [Nitriliruptorales bacterium]|nr:class II histone deacetylase [Nitriliruptorales bacterium]